MELLNISFKDFYSLQGEDRALYAIALRDGKFPQVDHFKLGDFMELPWGFVKDLQAMFCDTGVSFAAMLEIYVDFGYADKGAYDMGVFTLKEALRHAEENIININAMESANLVGSGLTAEEMEADPRAINELGVFNQLDELAQGQPWQYEVMRRDVKYKYGFLKLTRDNRKAEYRKRYDKILERKRKAKKI